MTNNTPISKSLLDSILSVSMSMGRTIECTNKHLSFIVDKTRIVSVGINSNKTHPRSAKLGYPLLGIHSELAAVLNAPNEQFSHCKLINVRLSNLSWRYGRPITRNSKPCFYCSKWCGIFKQVLYTTDNSLEIL